MILSKVQSLAPDVFDVSFFLAFYVLLVRGRGSCEAGRESLPYLQHTNYSFVPTLSKLFVSLLIQKALMGVEIKNVSYFVAPAPIQSICHQI